MPPHESVAALFTNAESASVARSESCGYVARDYRRRAGSGGLTGGVTAIQLASSDLRLNPHFHTLLVDGVYAPDSDGKLALHAAPGLRQEDVEAVLSAARLRILRYLERRGILAPVVTACDRRCPSGQIQLAVYWLCL